MYLKKLGVRNFRRLKNVVIDLASDISIFVGSNNSGKTSVGHALELFAGRNNFNVHDFSSDLWPDIIEYGAGDGIATEKLPAIELDIWFDIGENDVHRVVDLLPSLVWQGSLVGLRVIYAPVDPSATHARYAEVRQQALRAVPRGQDGEPLYDPSPRDLREYLRDRLAEEYELQYFVLDHAKFDTTMVAAPGYVPSRIGSKGRSGREILRGLLRVDFLNAQRHLSDGPGGSRSEELSRVLSRFYGRNLEKMGDDIEALSALAASEVSLNKHLERVFEPTLKSLSKLGYPGLTNPRMMIRSALDPAQIMSGRDGTLVHYALGADDGNPNPPTLPDRYNGLGFKNLIFMVVELLDLHAQWLTIEEGRPPVHLIFIEEPEAHLHAQLQQAFIRKVMNILELSEEDMKHHTSQIVVTTHSTHILYERGFRPIRYFRRTREHHAATSEILNLSVFYDGADPEDRTFLERYLKLAHCDLFFADGAVLVEGNVERLLLPQMIEKAASRLQSTYLTVLEIGGAFGHRFRSLIDYLGLTTLIITDLDSVFGPAALVPAAAAVPPAQGDGAAIAPAPVDEEEEEDEDSPDGAGKPGKACIASQADATTSNQTLLKWLPKLDTVNALWQATAEQKTQTRTADGDALVRVAYQCRTQVTWGGDSQLLAGRTLEEAFALENLEWSQSKDRKSLGLRIAKATDKDLDTLATLIHRRVQGKSFSKTDFALGLLAEEPKGWSVPAYIAEGLAWLELELAPPDPDDGHPGDDNQGAPIPDQEAVQG
ncbi:ATP-dependent nuclease [Stenotrophomonas sp. PD6]|uniref:ATP-dependent nuclease n=1 Tax=Stenotrophomonas sp. PD6 TaxID=3368612 RepID=UPI003BA39F83